AETPVPEGGAPWSKVGGKPGDLIPFGIDPNAVTLFAFDPSTTDALGLGDGEMGVVAWIHEIGIRSLSFSDFLTAILELCEADLETRKAVREASSRSEPTPRSAVRTKSTTKRPRRARSRAAG